MKDFIHDGSTVNRPNNALDIYLQELGSEIPEVGASDYEVYPQKQQA